MTYSCVVDDLGNGHLNMIIADIALSGTPDCATLHLTTVLALLLHHGDMLI